MKIRNDQDLGAWTSLFLYAYPRCCNQLLLLCPVFPHYRDFAEPRSNKNELHRFGFSQRPFQLILNQMNIKIKASVYQNIMWMNIIYIHSNSKFALHKNSFLSIHYAFSVFEHTKILTSLKPKKQNTLSFALIQSFLKKLVQEIAFPYHKDGLKICV